MRTHHKCGCVETNDGFSPCAQHDHGNEIDRLVEERDSLRSQLATARERYEALASAAREVVKAEGVAWMSPLTGAVDAHHERRSAVAALAALVERT